MKTLLLVIAALGAAACSSSSTGTGMDGDFNQPGGDPSQACLDTADAVGKAAQRCGQDYDANYTQFIQRGAGGRCSNIVKIRHEPSLRATCLPSLATISCPDLVAGRIHETCKGQLLRTASVRVAPSLSTTSLAESLFESDD